MNGFLDVLTDPVEWAKRWGIRPFPVVCAKCRRPAALTIPFAYGELRGLRSTACECGNERTPFVFVRDYRIGDLFDVPLKKPRPKKGRKKLAEVIQFPGGHHG